MTPKKHTFKDTHLAWLFPVQCPGGHKNTKVGGGGGGGDGVGGGGGGGGSQC